MAFSAIGIYSVNNSSFEIYLTALFGIFGFICVKLGFPPAPMLLGYVLGPMMEENLRRSMLMSGGDPSVFVTRPLSVAFLVATVLILIVMVAPAVRERRQEIADWRTGWPVKPASRHRSRRLRVSHRPPEQRERKRENAHGGDDRGQRQRARSEHLPDHDADRGRGRLLQEAEQR